jgi:hypothetical protein
MGLEHPNTTPDGRGEAWVRFPGGELEGERPRALCPACRRALDAAARGRAAATPASRSSRTACFQCYRAELERRRAMRAAGELDTATDARFQFQLPFEPVNHARLRMLKASRETARVDAGRGAGQFTGARRQAQLAARHVLQRLADDLRARSLAVGERDTRERALLAAIHAAELQLPESWLPFVVAR